MAEREAIMTMWRKGQAASAVLATLVRVEGSSYRRPGARIYIQPPGYAGSISGGCLEGDLLRKATWLSRNGPLVVRYSTAFDEAAIESGGEIPFGLGCGGVLDLLLEQAGSPEGTATLKAVEAAQQGHAFSSATLLPSSSKNPARLARVIVRQNFLQADCADPKLFFSSEALSSELRETLIGLAANATGPATVSVAVQGQQHTVYVEPILPSQRLVIFGAGDDARPLAEMARLLGWRVAVADGRAWLAQAARFPHIDQVLALTDDAGNLDELHLSAQDAVALLTHSFEQDKNLLHKLLPLELRYLGLLGARHRSKLLLSEVAQQLGWTPEECLGRIHAPIGLDLGGDSPEAVALTVIAEVQSILHGRAVVSRRMTSIGLQSKELHYHPAQCPLDEAPLAYGEAQETDTPAAITGPDGSHVEQPVQ